MPTPHELEQALRRADLRVTRPRLAVLAAVHRLAHADTGHITADVRAAGDEVSSQAVYDVLHALSDAGLIRRIQPEGAAALYEARVGDNHHHLVCRGCGEIVDVDCVTGDAPCLHVASGHGYVIDEAEVVFRGLCPSCASARAAATDPDPSPSEEVHHVR